MTVAEALRLAAQRLAETSDTARLDAEVLMAHALGVTRSDLLLRHTRDGVPDGFAALVERRAGHEPVAYITETQEFYGREFRVTPEVLIPRADSETIVVAALEASPARVLDCGVGSGTLLLTVLAERPAASGIGIDSSPGALAVAAVNAERLGLAARAEIRAGNWCEAGWSDRLGIFDLILANPPYVEDGADLALSVRAFEPASALFAGPAGLDDYRALIPQFSGLLSPNGIAVVEIGASQADAVRQIAEEAGFSAELRKDLGGRARAIILRLPLGKTPGSP
ncbi:MAG: peptide chain release factor N(5)-glutamine methyltransferase [Candidatus Andeanibacterium colombiense]|uniref:Release factor glutamine methyltransferase n=1 Tax=Candidatus Andeanibacterium colombiense TaxID=3121345 RepID=A0AAJ6BRC3_9SPHN|nr:MAG: peptide chain release factor N(5)-glutamine methyltransferase [Sphingomonadaceae bacterium]